MVSEAATAAAPARASTSAGAETRQAVPEKGETPPPPPPPPTDAEVKAHMEQVMATQLPRSPIYGWLLAGARVHAATRGRVRARLVLGPEHLNARGGLHGSVSATIIDWAGGMAVATWDLRARTGVSVDIHARYLASAGLGDEVEIDATADRVGNALAYTSIAIRKVVHPDADEVGPLLVSGTHTKYVKKP